MTFPIYPRPTGQSQSSVPLPIGTSTLHASPQGYIPDAGLANAVNVALLLGQPLLLTGEPGTGKTGLAYHLSWNLDLGKPFVFEAKTTSTAKDLFYTIDTLGRFRAGPAKDGVLDFLTYQALGKAILVANPRSSIQGFISQDFEHDGPRRSVVLVDEIDKAPRDFPNDILTEVEYMRFKVPELSDAYITTSERYRPILVLTSNSEKHLPDAFLRRCIYYDIPFPSLERLREIVLERLDFSGREKTQSLDQALDFFIGLRNDSVRLTKRPATAELLGWLDFLARRAQPKDLRYQPDVLQESLCCLIKGSDDTRRASEFLEDWVRNRK